MPGIGKRASSHPRELSVSRSRSHNSNGQFGGRKLMSESCLTLSRPHGPSSRAWKSCTCPRLSVAAFRTMLELELGPLFISKSSNLATPPPPRTFGGDSSCSRESLHGSLANFSRANCTSIVWSIQYCLSSFRFIVPSPGWMPVSVTRHAVAAAFYVQAPQTNPDRFTGTTPCEYVSYDSYASSVDSATTTLAVDPNARDSNGRASR